MVRDPVAVQDLIVAGVHAQETLALMSDDRWLEKPPSMGWTRLVTVSHICGALLFYATQLAVGSGKREETVRPDESAITGEKLPELMIAQVKLLAAVAASAEPGTRAWHPVGLPDTEGVLAMGCAEVMLHSWDAVGGLDLEFVGDEGISDRVLRRLFPWAPAETPCWQTLLFVTGRGELPGFESPGDRWMWHNDVLEEWDGREKWSDRWVGRA